MAKVLVVLIPILLIVEIAYGYGQSENNGKDKHKPFFRPTMRNITVEPGGRAQLRCRVENLGTKAVTWRRERDRHPLTVGLYTFDPDTRISIDYNQRVNEWTLIIQDVKPTDEGTYRCEISTQSDENSYSIQLNVKTVQVTGQQFVEKGEPVHLICNASGKPDPPHDVVWYKESQEIDSDAQTGILITKKIETKALISVLVIKQSKLSDSGKYTCRSSSRDAGYIDIIILDVAAPNVKRGTSQQKLASGGSRGLHTLTDSYLLSLSTLMSLLVTQAFTRWHNNT